MTDSDSRDSELHPLVRRLLEKTENRAYSYVSRYRMPKSGVTVEEPDSVLVFLGLEPTDLSPMANETLDALEHMAAPEWYRFKWQLTAFTYIQDAFDTPFYDAVDKDALLLFEQFYFYFESLRLMRESLLCGLNGFAVAANALLRPFLEFSVLQNYYYRQIEERRSYAELLRYFRGGPKPGIQVALKKALPKDSFCKPVRFRINQHLSGLSESTLHPYHPILSQAQHRSDVHLHSIDSLHFWQALSLTLEAALWLYYVNFPMLFSPVDVLRRFGYNGPVGVFVDRLVAEAVKKSLAPQDHDAFFGYAKAQQKTLDHLAFYNSHPDLTDQEIEAGWRTEEDGPFPGLHHGQAHSAAKLRSLRGALAHNRRMRIEERLKNYPEALDTLEGWKQLAKRIGKPDTAS